MWFWHKKSEPPLIRRMRRWLWLAIFAPQLLNLTLMWLNIDGHLLAHSRQVYVSFAVIPAMFVPVILIQLRIWKLKDKARAAEYKICPECGYSLEGSPDPGACPECGKAFTGRSLRDSWIYGINPQSP